MKQFPDLGNLTDAAVYHIKLAQYSNVYLLVLKIKLGIVENLALKNHT